MKVSDAINIDKDILGGMPVFKGTRIPIKNLFDYLEAGDSLNDFLNDFDYIPREHCLMVLEASEQLLTEVVLFNVGDKLTGPKKTTKRPIDFRGTLKLTGEQYEDFQSHLKDIRGK